MRKQRELTEQQKRDAERFQELMAKESNKKLNRKITKGHVAWWCNTLGFVFFFWLLWDVIHWNEYLFVEWRVNFGIFKFFAAIILLAVAGNLGKEK